MLWATTDPVLRAIAFFYHLSTSSNVPFEGSNRANTGYGYDGCRKGREGFIGMDKLCILITPITMRLV
jgi:hypothetical protein